MLKLDQKIFMITLASYVYVTEMLIAVCVSYYWVFEGFEASPSLVCGQAGS